MNEFEPVNASQIDCLVDGELSQVERRAVLIALDRDTDGWRRLALTFLESQAMRESLRHAPLSPVIALQPDSPEAVNPCTTSLQVRPKPQKTGTARGRVLALAVCSLLMFGLGRLSVPSPGVPLPAHPSPATYTSPDPPVDRGNPNPVLVAESKSSVPQHTLRLELGDSQGGPTETVEVPVVENSSITPEALMWAPPVISENVQRALLRSGRRVHEQRQLYEVTLEDGRHGVVPISEVMVEDAGWDVYQ